MGTYSQTNKAFNFKIIDSESGKPIENCLVKINDSELQTDSKGEINFSSLSSFIRLNIKHLGYLEYKKNYNPDSLQKPIILKLIPSAVKLSEVNVIDTLNGKTKNRIAFKKMDLYDSNAEDNQPNIEGFYALNLFSESLSNEIWFTPNKNCIQVEPTIQQKFSGEKCLKINWNKIGGGCEWIGMGIGWDAWSGKDISSIIGKSAIQFFVKTNGDTLKNLPLALALEDYSGTQAFIGFSNRFIDGGKITSEWTKITIPIEAFPFVQRDFDIFNVKQFIIQFEAEGSIYLDEISIVPFTGSLKASYSITKKSSIITMDGIDSPSEWNCNSILLENSHTLKFLYDEQFLYVFAKVFDKSPAINDSKDADIWNGDAIELALGTNPEAPANREFFMFSDYQIGIKISDKPYIYNWKKRKREENCNVEIKKYENYYTAEIQIPLTVFGDFKFLSQKKYGFEAAIDIGDASGKRMSQARWSSAHTEGFHKNPSLWGTLIINP